MTDIDLTLPQVALDLGALSVQWALVGGLAVCARADPRPTADIDIAVAVPDDAAANALIEDLATFGYRLRESIVHDQTGGLATVRLDAPTGVAVDLFFASSGVEAEVVQGAEPVEVAPGLTMPVARLGHLIAVKLLWRPSDKRDRDLRSLIHHANPTDLDDARNLSASITQRGYHRGRDLDATLADWLPGVDEQDSG